MAAKRRTPEEKQAARENVLWSALAAFASKHSDRDRLEAGSRHELAVTIAGECDGGWIETELSGRLLVNHDQEVAASVAPNYVGLVALLLAEIPIKKRLHLAKHLPERLLTDGQLPPAPREVEELAAILLKDLRQKTTQTRRGSVRFEQLALADSR